MEFRKCAAARRQQGMWSGSDAFGNIPLQRCALVHAESLLSGAGIARKGMDLGLLLPCRSRADGQRLQGLACGRERRNLGSGLVGTQESNVEEATARQDVKLKADFGKTKAPALQPSLEISPFLPISFGHHDQINIASHARVSQFRAAVQIDIAHPKPGRIDGCCDTFGESLPPSPVFGCRPQALTAEFALLPLQILADSVRNVVEKFLFFAKKGAFPGDRLFILVMNLDDTHLRAPNGDGRAHPPWSVHEIGERVSAAEVFDAGGGSLGVLPGWRDGLKNPVEDDGGSFFTARESGDYRVKASEFFRSFAERPEFFGLARRNRNIHFPMLAERLNLSTKTTSTSRRLLRHCEARWLVPPHVLRGQALLVRSVRGEARVFEGRVQQVILWKNKNQSDDDHPAEQPTTAGCFIANVPARERPHLRRRPSAKRTS